jgi:hypothetical protein
MRGGRRRRIPILLFKDNRSTASMMFKISIETSTSMPRNPRNSNFSPGLGYPWG